MQMAHFINRDDNRCSVRVCWRNAITLRNRALHDLIGHLIVAFRASAGVFRIVVSISLSSSLDRSIVADAVSVDGAGFFFDIMLTELFNCNFCTASSAVPHFGDFSKSDLLVFATGSLCLFVDFIKIPRLARILTALLAAAESTLAVLAVSFGFTLNVI